MPSLRLCPSIALPEAHTVDDWFAQHVGSEQVKPGLERIRAALERFGAPDSKIPTVLVAGTNGKGTVSGHLAARLQGAGLRVGLLTSPHLLSITERVLIDGQLCTAASWQQMLERINKEESTDVLSYFELVTLAAWLMFDAAHIDVAVLEVGLGGRWDATNAASNVVVTAITSVGLDHTEFLGETTLLIATEKAAIARAGVPLTVPPLGSDVDAVITQCALQAGAKLTRVDPRADADASVALAMQLFEQATQALHHKHEAADQSVALAIGPIPVRCELLASQPPLVVDAAHNEDSARRLASFIGRHAQGAVWHAYCCIASRKDVPSVIGPLVPHAKQWSVVDLSADGFDADALAQTVQSLTGTQAAVVSLNDALQVLLDQPRTAPTVVFGSFMLAGPARAAVASGSSEASQWIVEPFAWPSAVKG